MNGPDAHHGWIAVGQVVGAFGPRGDLRVQPLSRFPERFRLLDRLYVGDRYDPATVVHRRMHRGRVILHLDTVKSREAARALQGIYLYVPEVEAVALPAGEYFVHQIVGLSVVTSEGQTLGSVEEVLQTGSNDVYIVRGPRGEVLLPATKEVVKQVDLAGGRICVEPLPGLLE